MCVFVRLCTCMYVHVYAYHSHVGRVQFVCLGEYPAFFPHYLTYPWQCTWLRMISLARQPLPSALWLLCNRAGKGLVRLDRFS